MKRIQTKFAILLCAALLGPVPTLSRADDIADKGRGVFQKYQHAVVTVQLVLKSKISMGGRGGQSNESRQEVTGTVIDPSGLTVLSLSATDPGQMVQNLMADDERFKMETEVSDIKILLEDGGEVPAEIVLRDKDLDLAFIRPKSKLTTPLQAVDLTQTGKAEILDPVIGLNRLGNAAGRAFSASVERISAIVHRPRLFYVPDSNMTTSSLGCPAFTTDGKFLGLFVMRAIKGRSSAASIMTAQSGNYTGVILPAEDIAKGAKQVPAEGKGEEKKGEDKPAEEKK
jgi:hypothetical protein